MTKISTIISRFIIPPPPGEDCRRIKFIRFIENGGFKVFCLPLLSQRYGRQESFRFKVKCLNFKVVRKFRDGE